MQILVKKICPKLKFHSKGKNLKKLDPISYMSFYTTVRKKSAEKWGDERAG